MLCQCRLGRWLSLYSLNMNITKRQLKKSSKVFTCCRIGSTCILSNCLPSCTCSRTNCIWSNTWTANFPWICLLFPMITSKAQMLNVMKNCDGADTLTREEKFQVFCRVCDNMLDQGRLSKANHSRWTNIW